MRKKCCYSRGRTLGQYSSLFLSPLISHTQQTSPFENKVWEIYIFIKKCIHRSLKLSLTVNDISECKSIFVYVHVQLYGCEYTTNIYGLVLWHINPYRLFNAKSSLYIYIKYIWFGSVWFYGISSLVDYLMLNPFYAYILNIYDLVGFYGISTIVGYLMPNPLYTYILNIYDLVWLGFMAYQPL